MSLQEWPFNRYPDFVAGGSTLLSGKAVRDIQAASMFVNMFPIEDTYLGIVAKKLGLQLLHNSRFINDDKVYDRDKFDHVIAFHGGGDWEFVYQIWKEQRERGNA